MGLFDFLGGQNGSMKISAPQFWSQENQYNNEQQAQAAQNQQNTAFVADAMLKNQQQQQLAQAQAQAASARGNVSPALLQRNVMKNTTEANQQGIGQASQIRAQQAFQQQQLNDEMALKYRQMGLQQQQAQAQATLQAQGQQAQLAAENQRSQSNFLGGLMSAGGALGAAAIMGPAAAAPVAAQAVGSTSSYGGNNTMYAYKGGLVPGKAKNQGNSIKNDTVPAMLSPGEIVIPKSHSKDLEKAHAFLDALAAKKYKKSTSSKGEVEDVLKMNGGGEVPDIDEKEGSNNDGSQKEMPYSYGLLLAAQAHLHERLKALESAKKKGKR